ncbi:MRG-domain-containing protein [Trichodelitschia bisporula]|uniref:Chromatin modification-related protein EAF3 n=1 Tax=Trichodelitschia bisporula TaxID=703511 RepID=A0A6G1I9R7_9PEZI|nr:MRG-domain-containing protein [Trichodelitschia bisporula]
MAPPIAAFSKDERVLCFHENLMYEARVLGVKFEENEKKGAWVYMVHYKGWKNTWDDWVAEDRLRQFNDENQALARQLKKDMDAARDAARKSHAKKKGTSTRDSEDRNSSVPAAGKKRGRDFEIEKLEDFHSKPTVRIIIPDILKSILVDDWENITRNGQLTAVPADIPASLVLDEYHKQNQAGHGQARADILEEVVYGLKEYFNKACGTLLLYKQERAQYAQLLARFDDPSDSLMKRPLSDVYGAEHLLRLLTQLPSLIAYTDMDTQSVGRLREELNQFTNWLSRSDNIERFLSRPYVSAQ